MKKQEKLKAGPCVKVNGRSTDAGLYDHVFNGEDNKYDEIVKAKMLLNAAINEMKKRGLLKENLEAQLKENIKNMLKDLE